MLLPVVLASLLSPFPSVTYRHPHVWGDVGGRPTKRRKLDLRLPIGSDRPLRLCAWNIEGLLTHKVRTAPSFQAHDAMRVQRAERDPAFLNAPHRAPTGTGIFGT